jgi:hypothetical protein
MLLPHTLVHELKRQLKNRHPRAFHLVNPSIMQGKLILSGIVASFHHRQICIELAKGLRDVSEIIDQLRVENGASKSTPYLTSRRPARPQNNRPTVSQESVL